jgi:hypothetical protein
VRRARLTTVTSLGAAITLSLAGCNSGGPKETPTVTAPAGLSVSVLQYRSDYAIRHIQIKVTNAGPAPVTVTAARLSSSSFTGPATWAERNAADAASIAPGEATDLPAQLASSDCTGHSASSGTVRLELRRADGTIERTTALPVGDPFGTINQVHSQDCRRAAALAIANLTLLKPLRTQTRSGQLVGLLDLRLTPTGRPGTLSLDSIGPTTLLDPPGGAVWVIHRDVSARTGPRTVTLDLHPARCDPHAIAEDKLGTVLYLALRVDDGRSGLVTVAADPQLRQQIQDFVTAACRISGSG